MIGDRIGVLAKIVLTTLANGGDAAIVDSMKLPVVFGDATSTREVNWESKSLFTALEMGMFETREVKDNTMRTLECGCILQGQERRLCRMLPTEPERCNTR